MKRYRIGCLAAVCCLLPALLPGCAKRRAEEAPQNESEASFSQLLAGMSKDTETELSSLTQTVQKVILADGRLRGLGWGWQQGSAAEEPEWVPQLVGCAADGSDAVCAALQLPEAETKEESSPSAICGDESGGLYLLLALEHPQEEALAGVPGSRSYFLYTLSTDGALRDPLELECLEDEVVLASAAANGTAWLASDSFIVRVGLSSGEVQRFSLPQTLQTPEVCPLSDNTAVVLDEIAGCWYQVDAQGGFSQKQMLPERLTKTQLLHPVITDGQTQRTAEKVLLWDGNAIYQWSPAKNEAQPVMRWMDASLNANDLLEVAALADGRYLTVQKKEREEKEAFRLVLLTPSTPEILNARTVLTLGTYDEPTPALRAAVLAFNNASDSVFIQLQDFTLSDDADLGQCILRGDGPDILLLSNAASNNQYLNKGIFLDLYPFLDADPELSREDLQKNILAAAEYSGQLPTLIAAYDILTAVGAADMLGAEPGWGWQAYEEARAAYPQVQTVYNGVDRLSVLHDQVQVGGRRFLDMAAGKAAFDTPEFVRFLEESAAYPEQVSSAFQNTREIMQQQQSLLCITYLTAFSELPSLRAPFDGDIVFKGFPSDEGCGSAILPRLRIAISSGCKAPQEAWQFVRTLLLPSFQRQLTEADGGQTHFPLRSDVLRQALEAHLEAEEAQPEAQQDEDVVSRKDGEKLLELIDRLDTVFQYDDVVFHILSEEAQAYYQGAVPAQTAAENIQQRLQNWLDEQQ